MREKVLLITHNFYPEIGSAGNRMKNIYQLLKDKGYEVTVLTTEASYPNKKLYDDRKFWDDDSLNQDKNIHRVSVTNRKYSTSMFNRLLYYLEVTLRMILFVLFDRKKYETVFVSSPPIFIGLVGVIAKIKYSAKLILDIRDLWPESLKGVGVFNYKPIIWLFSLFERFLYHRANHIVVNSLAFIDYIHLRSNKSKEQIKFIPNAARFSELSIENKESSNDFKVIYTGNLGLAQDVEFLKKLAVQLNQYKIHMNIVGYGVKRTELVEFVKMNQLDYVGFIKPTIREECLKINTQHDVALVSLEDKEVFDTVLPGKIIDYMITGLPLIASTSGYSKYIIEKYEVGYVSEKRDVDEIINSIITLKNNENIRKQMSMNGKKLINSQFLWEENIEVLIDVIESRDQYQYQFNKQLGKKYG